jgi:hypothetical protein
MEINHDFLNAFKKLGELALDAAGLHPKVIEDVIDIIDTAVKQHQKNLSTTEEGGNE